MKRVYVNEKWCLGCHLCEYYCAFAATGKDDMARALKGVKLRPRIHIEGDEKGSDLKNVTFAVSCRHCTEPLCVKGCITGALTKTDGVISVDKDKCVGCYTCVLSCPYGCIQGTDEGAVDKCELCVSTREGTPRCVAGCPNAAIVFEER
ncbi:MAG: 4Fe-4S binding protein [Oscillospiraceae bacterium]|jgi:carbon-monoxide dehydrogenase iron sulfur subunit|nr:4Fe-4S binding protein [Oscillospiraceae bacterium]